MQKNLLENPNVHAYDYGTDYEVYNSADEILLPAATDYETYSGQSYAPAADGTVSGVTSVYPIITLLSDVENITIECE